MKANGNDPLCPNREDLFLIRAFPEFSSGRAGVSEMRTSFGIKFILGMPLPQYNLAPFVANPFRFTWNSQGCADAPATNPSEADSGPRHPFCKVMEWEQRLLTEKNLTRAQLAREEGFSKAYVTQMLRLLRLPIEAREHLVALRSPEIIRSFSLRRLAAVVHLPADRRSEAFSAMKSVANRSGC